MGDNAIVGNGLKDMEEILEHAKVGRIALSDDSKIPDGSIRPKLVQAIDRSLRRSQATKCYHACFS